MDKLLIKKLKKLFNEYSCIKLGYVLSFKARRANGFNMAYTFAVYLNQSSNLRRFNFKLKLMRALSELLETEKIDVFVLNDDISSSLKFSFIKEGILLKEVEPYGVIVEPRILNEYWDFKLMYDKVFK